MMRRTKISARRSMCLLRQDARMIAALLLGVICVLLAMQNAPPAPTLTLTEALDLVNKNGEFFYEAELYRLKGELLLNQTGPDAHEAETCFHRALDIAHRQQAKALELRATMSLSRLWQQQKKQEAARELLAKVYNWFTEGFDTTDLKAAKALLEALG